MHRSYVNRVFLGNVSTRVCYLANIYVRELASQTLTMIMIRRAGTTVHILTWKIELLSIFVSVVFRKYTLLKNVTPFIVWKLVQIRFIIQCTSSAEHNLSRKA